MIFLTAKELIPTHKTTCFPSTRYLSRINQILGTPQSTEPKTNGESEIILNLLQKPDTEKL